MSTTPVTFESEWVEPRSRLTTFFRGVLAIPHFVLAGLWGVAAAVAILIAWFAILITGHYPPGLYAFVASFARYVTGTYGYLYLLTDEYPPFSGSADTPYPVRLGIGPPLPQYSRVMALFRIFIAIPMLVVNYAMQLVAQVGAFIAWFAILFLGRQVRGLQEMIELGLSYQQRSSTFLYLLNEDWFPPIAGPAALASGPSRDMITPAPPAPPAPPAGGLSPRDPDPFGN